MKRLILPVWFDRASNQEKIGFLIGYAAAYATPKGTITELCEITRISSASIHHGKKAGYLGESIARRIEACVGREIIRWEWLVNPDALLT